MKRAVGGEGKALKYRWEVKERQGSHASPTYAPSNSADHFISILVGLTTVASPGSCAGHGNRFTTRPDWS